MNQLDEILFDEKRYFYLLLIIPVLIVFFILLQFWKRKVQLRFAATGLLQKLTPTKSSFKGTLKLILLVLGLSFLTLGLVNPKIGTKLEKVKREGGTTGMGS